ncbi:flagellar component of cell-proximal portion of basal-body rod [Candidatus Hydrogenisulfobacillus filiaventi]|uniref:Flagellar basal-body rod protein FlgC n=1 Tax=Candidatus Hydrogenisulfobacillus filiaventi TaxID=2707344 RepID=A0A6F8ZE13_9FIRM|nr:flagellar basal body rod protein FlgC [Bacillota bacterium]CAB1128007.1 flagellar component of cell-proximal portion of basal-body rod [Candidatus Hydrogenisulfobacillus filiaventi]
MFDGMRISASALTAEAVRLAVTADNLANLDTTAGVGGQPYRRQFVVLAPRPAPAAGPDAGVGQGVRVAAILPDLSPFKVVYDPASPLANAQGDVLYPNVHLTTEMVDLIAASRAYQANVTAFNAAKAMEVKVLSL